MLFRHGLQYLVARGLPGVINFVGIAVYTRLLDPVEYGAYTLTIAAVGAADALLFQWFRLALLRFLPNEQLDPRVTLATILKGFLGMAAVVSVLAVLVAFVVVKDEVTRQLLLLGAGVFVVQGIFELTVERERSGLSPVRYGLYSGAKAVIGLAVGVTLALAGMGANGLLIGLVAAMLLPLVGLGGLRQWLQVGRTAFDSGLARTLLVYGLPLAATAALDFVVSSSDRFMLAAFIDSAAAGKYAVGYDLAQFTLGMLLMVVNLASYPLIVSAFEERGAPAARATLARTFQLMLLVGLPAVAGLAVLSRGIAAVMVGPEFREAAAGIIPWIAVAAFIGGLKHFYFDVAFQLSTRTGTQFWIVLVSAVLNVGLNALWIPRYGLLGAVYATVVAYVIAIILSWWFGRTAFAVPVPVRRVIPIFLATALMVAALLLVRGWTGLPSLVAQVAIGVLVYGFGLLLGGRRLIRELVFERSGPGESPGPDATS